MRRIPFQKETAISDWLKVCPLEDIPRLGAKVVKDTGKGDIAVFRNAEDASADCASASAPATWPQAGDCPGSAISPALAPVKEFAEGDLAPAKAR